MDARHHHHLFNTNMSESNGAAAAYEAMGVGSSRNPYQGAGGCSHASLPSDVMHVSTTAGTGGPVKRKRGRPRKYVPSNMSIVASPSAPSTSVVKPSSGRAFSTTTAAKVPADAAKRAWVLSPNSNKKQKMEATAEAQMKAHVLFIPAGEEISSKILAFAQQAQNTVIVLAATGTISSATLHQASSSGGTVSYEGPFEILTLSGSFLLFEHDGKHSRKGSISVLLASPDGRVLGGVVAGPLTAASRVELVIGSFNAEEKNEQEQMGCIEPVSALEMLAAPLKSLGQSMHPRGAL